MDNEGNKQVGRAIVDNQKQNWLESVFILLKYYLTIRFINMFVGYHFIPELTLIFYWLIMSSIYMLNNVSERVRPCLTLLLVNTVSVISLPVFITITALPS